MIVIIGVVEEPAAMHCRSTHTYMYSNTRQKHPMLFVSGFTPRKLLRTGDYRGTTNNVHVNERSEVRIAVTITSLRQRKVGGSSPGEKYYYIIKYLSVASFRRGKREAERSRSTMLIGERLECQTPIRDDILEAWVRGATG